MLRSFLLFMLLSHWTLSAGSALPQQLTAEERRQVTRLLGVNTSSKLLSHPYPLGGYQGLEAGVSLQLVDTSDLDGMGCTPGSPGCPAASKDLLRELRLTRIHLGKGLYSNVDLFFHFSPPLGSHLSREFGALLRWNFYQSSFNPTQLTAVIHSNQLNYADSFTAQTLGGLLVLGVYFPQRSIYLGLGYLQSTGTFSGGDGSNATILNSISLSESVQEFHSLVGASLDFGPWFLALQVDRYQDMVYSAKLGVRL